MVPCLSLIASTCITQLEEGEQEKLRLMAGVNVENLERSFALDKKNETFRAGDSCSNC